MEKRHQFYLAGTQKSFPHHFATQQQAWAWQGNKIYIAYAIYYAQWSTPFGALKYIYIYVLVHEKPAKKRMAREVINTV